MYFGVFCGLCVASAGGQDCHKGKSGIKEPTCQHTNYLLCRYTFACEVPWISISEEKNEHGGAKRANKYPKTNIHWIGRCDFSCPVNRQAGLYARTSVAVTAQ